MINMIEVSDDDKRKEWSTNQSGMIHTAGADTDIIGVPRSVLAAACYIIRNSEHAESETAKVMREYALSTQSAELDALRGEVVTADHSRTCYARALEKMRIALVNINDGLEDEGDRIYLGSTNHADDIRAAWQIADALNWDEILEHTQPKTDIAATNFRLQATIAQLRDRVAGLEEGFRNIRPYLEWTISDESPGYHPTMPSAVAAFSALLNHNGEAG